MAERMWPRSPARETNSGPSTLQRSSFGKLPTSTGWAPSQSLTGVDCRSVSVTNRSTISPGMSCFCLSRASRA
jgi:hypothetical protein